MTGKEALLSQVSVTNMRMRSLNFETDTEKEETIISVTEVACDTEKFMTNLDAIFSHGVVKEPDSPPMFQYTFEAKLLFVA